jgi:hypothetical protein
MVLAIKLSLYMFRPMTAIIGRLPTLQNKMQLNFITKNIVVLDGIQS